MNNRHRGQTVFMASTKATLVLPLKSAAADTPQSRRATMPCECVPLAMVATIASSTFLVTANDRQLAALARPTISASAASSTRMRWVGLFAVMDCRAPLAETDNGRAVSFGCSRHRTFVTRQKDAGLF